MSQNGTKRKTDENKKPIFLRGIKPSTRQWLQNQVDQDAPTLPKAVKRIVEDKHREDMERKRGR